MLRALFLLFIIIPLFTKAQIRDPQRFNNEINKLIDKEVDIDSSKSTLLFTGSSSIRMWKTLESAFPIYNTVNHGFGGSTMHDLLFYLDTIVSPIDAEVIFIYEGDNDVALKYDEKGIIKDTKKVIKKIKKKDKKQIIVLISAKPSPLRWDMKDGYHSLNSRFEKMAKKKRIYYCDVWTPMLDDSGEVMKNIFLKDDLHMNEEGYLIWKEAIEKILLQIKNDHESLLK